MKRVPVPVISQMMLNSFKMLLQSTSSLINHLDKKYSEQAVLVHEASEALKVSESCTKELQKELDALKKNGESDIQMAVGGAVLQYKELLSTEQSRTQDQQATIAELQGQIQALQESMTSQKDLPSVPSEGVTQEGKNLREKVFNYVPGTVNTRRGAAVYDSPDQPYSFQKHVRFRDRFKQPDLESDVVESGITTNYTNECINTITCSFVDPILWSF